MDRQTDDDGSRHSGLRDDGAACAACRAPSALHRRAVACWPASPMSWCRDARRGVRPCRSSLLPAPPPAARAAAIGVVRRRDRNGSNPTRMRTLRRRRAGCTGRRDWRPRPELQDSGRLRGGAIASEEEKGGCGEQQKTFCGHLGGGRLPHRPQALSWKGANAARGLRHTRQRLLRS